MSHEKDRPRVTWADVLRARQEAWQAETAPRAENALPVHWVSDAPTSLHGNGAASFERTTRDEQEVTCRLCVSLLRKCGECGHRHTSDGCTGDPTPSDLWAGVTPGVCDCPRFIPPA